MTNYPIYKNPKSLYEFGSKVRAIADKQGNLYVAKDDGQFFHGTMGRALGFGEIYDDKRIEKYPLLQRIGSTNDFGLSDTTNSYIQNERINPRKVLNILKLTKNKNPQYGFYLEFFLNVGPQHKRV